MFFVKWCSDSESCRDECWRQWRIILFFFFIKNGNVSEWTIRMGVHHFSEHVFIFHNESGAVTTRETHIEMTGLGQAEVHDSVSFFRIRDGGFEVDHGVHFRMVDAVIHTPRDNVRVFEENKCDVKLSVISRTYLCRGIFLSAVARNVVVQHQIRMKGWERSCSRTRTNQSSFVCVNCF